MHQLVPDKIADFSFFLDSLSAAIGRTHLGSRLGNNILNITKDCFSPIDFCGNNATAPLRDPKSRHALFLFHRFLSVLQFLSLFCPILPACLCAACIFVLVSWPKLPGRKRKSKKKGTADVVRTREAKKERAGWFDAPMGVVSNFDMFR